MRAPIPLIFAAVILSSYRPLIADVATNAASAGAPASAINKVAAAQSDPSDADWAKILDMAHVAKGQHEPSQRATLDLALLTQAQVFIAKYPVSSHTMDARLLAAQTGDEMLQHKMSGTPTQAAVTKSFDQLATDPKLPVEQRAEIRFTQISETLDDISDETAPSPATWAKVETRIKAFAKEFGPGVSIQGQAPALARLWQLDLIIREAAQDPGYEALLQKLAHDPEPTIAEMAHARLATQKMVDALKTKPLDLKFTSVDGRTVDLSSLRGKVVLIDFWATWCGPCRDEVPNVVAAYQKLNPKGFEIIGISLDRDVLRLKTFIKDHGMVWPQYFDGQVWNNAISKKYGIGSIPEMWLVNKQGLLVTTHVDAKLEPQIEALLKDKG